MNKLAVDARNLMVRNLGVVDFVITFVGWFVYVLAILIVGPLDCVSLTVRAFGVRRILLQKIVPMFAIAARFGFVGTAYFLSRPVSGMYAASSALFVSFYFVPSTPLLFRW